MDQGRDRFQTRRAASPPLQRSSTFPELESGRLPRRTRSFRDSGSRNPGYISSLLSPPEQSFNFSKKNKDTIWQESELTKELEEELQHGETVSRPSRATKFVRRGSKRFSRTLDENGVFKASTPKTTGTHGNLPESDKYEFTTGSFSQPSSTFNTPIPSRKPQSDQDNTGIGTPRPQARASSPPLRRGYSSKNAQPPWRSNANLGTRNSYSDPSSTLHSNGNASISTDPPYAATLATDQVEVQQTDGEHISDTEDKGVEKTEEQPEEMPKTRPKWNIVGSNLYNEFLNASDTSDDDDVTETTDHELDRQSTADDAKDEADGDLIGVENQTKSDSTTQHDVGDDGGDDVADEEPVVHDAAPKNRGSIRNRTSRGDSRTSPQRESSSRLSSSGKRCDSCGHVDPDDVDDEEEEGDEEPVQPLYHAPDVQWSVQKQEYEQPTSIVITPSGKVVVANYSHNILQFFDKTGALEFDVEGIKPFSVIVDNDGQVVVGDRKRKTVRIFDEYGSDVCEWSENILDWVCGLSIQRNGNVVVCDRQHCKIKIFTPNGEWLSEFGSHGTKDNQFAMADFLVVDSRDRIIVADSGNHCIKVFNSTGKYLFKFGSRGRRRGELEWPKGVCVDGKDNIIVADMRNKRVCLFNSDGQFIQYIAKKLPYMPYAVCFSPPNEIGVTHFGLDGRSDLCVYRLDEVTDEPFTDQTPINDSYLETMV